MFGLDWSDPQTFWINVTNLAMGMLVLLAMAGVAWALLGDLRDRAQARVNHRAMASVGGRPFFDPELGLTMPDGGEKDEPKNPERVSR